MTASQTRNEDQASKAIRQAVDLMRNFQGNGNVTALTNAITDWLYNNEDAIDAAEKWTESTEEADKQMLEVAVDLAVGAWHDESNLLYDFLGWTEEEYIKWVQDPDAIPRMPKHYRGFDAHTDISIETLEEGVNLIGGMLDLGMQDKLVTRARLWLDSQEQVVANNTGKPIGNAKPQGKVIAIQTIRGKSQGRSFGEIALQQQRAADKTPINYDDVSGNVSGDGGE